jgi:transposase
MRCLWQGSVPLASSSSRGRVEPDGCQPKRVEHLIPLVRAVPAVSGAVGRPRRPPDTLIADRGYDSANQRRRLRERGIRPVIARRYTEHGSGLGRDRWVVERLYAWLHNFKRLLVHYERRADMHETLLAPGCCLVCFRRRRSSI